MDTYVISLERSTDRRKHMIEMMSSIGMEFQFWHATDGSKLTSKEISEYICQDAVMKWSAKKRPLSSGEIGCALSHIRLWKHLVATKTPVALILEDDITFESESFESTLNEVASKISGREVALLNCNVNSTWIFKRNRLKTGERLCYANGKANLTSAYVVTIEAAAALLRRVEVEKLGFPIDCWVHQSRSSFATTVRTRVVLPNPVRQVGDSLPSTIGACSGTRGRRGVVALIGRFRNLARSILPPPELEKGF